MAGDRRQTVRRYLEALAGASNDSDQARVHAEAAFIAVARAYSESEGITYDAWRAEGVAVAVLDAAGLGPAAQRSPAVPASRKMVCPKPLLRCWLLLLVGEAPRHGADLFDALVAAGAEGVDQTRLQRLLHDLEVEGALVASGRETLECPASEQRVYSLTAAGDDALDACAAGVAELRRTLDVLSHTPVRGAKPTSEQGG